MIARRPRPPIVPNPAQPAAGVQVSARRFRWKRVALPAGLLLACLLAFIFRVPILVGIAEWWIVDEESYGADAIVVLSGKVEVRPFAAIDLYRDKQAPLILLTNGGEPPPLLVGITPSEAQAARTAMRRAGIPDYAIVVLPQKVGSTFDEAMAVRAWAEAYEARRIIVATDLFHTRRVKWLFDRVLGGTRIEVTVVAVQQHLYTKDNWWRTEEGFVDFYTEVLKNIYYHWNY
jgi:uncharacterized SAM-binding protein YcdF (DUF218 family)